MRRTLDLFFNYSFFCDWIWTETWNLDFNPYINVHVHITICTAVKYKDLLNQQPLVCHKHWMVVGLQWLTGWWRERGSEKEIQPLQATNWSLRPHSIQPERKLELSEQTRQSKDSDGGWIPIRSDSCTHNHTSVHTQGQIFTQTLVLKHQWKRVNEPILEI